MASYLTGQAGQDYIPHLQSFNPDFNFYQSALQTKQAQYQQGYNKISGLYSSMLNSPMTRDDNNNRRDAFFKGINENIQKISGMDLSLEENINSAYKVFDPIIHDKDIIKDISYTKDAQAQLQKGESFRGVDPSKGLGSYWDGGIRAIHYKIDEFRNASPDDALKMDSPRFTPMVNTPRNALDLATKMKINVTRSSTDGKYIYTTTNGAAIAPGLANYFMGVFGDDGVSKDMYDTKAYLKIKDDASEYAAKHNVSQDVAENTVLNQYSDIINQQNKRNQSSLNTGLDLMQAKANILHDRVENDKDPRFNKEKASAQVQDYIEQIQQAQKTKQTYNNVGDWINRSTTVGATKDVLMNRVKSALSTHIMRGELEEAAKGYADLTYEQKMVPNEYGLIATRHMNDVEDIRLKAALEEHKIGTEWYYKTMFKDNLSRGGTDENTFKTITPSYVGNTSGPETMNIAGGYKEHEDQDKEIVSSRSRDYLQAVMTHYKSIMNSKDVDTTQDARDVARINLKNIMGNLVDDNGELKTPLNKINYEDLNPVYNRAVADVHADSNLPMPSSSDQFQQDMINIERDVDNGHKLYNAQNINHTKLNTDILGYVNGRAGRDIPLEEKNDFNMLMNSKGKVLTAEQFTKVYMAHNPGTDENDGVKAFNRAHDNYINMINNPPAGLDTRTWDGTVVKGGGGKGVGNRSTVVEQSARGDSPLSDGNRNLLSVKDNLDKLNPTDYTIVLGGVNNGTYGFADQSVLNKQMSTSPEAKKMWDIMSNDLSNSYKRNDKNQVELKYTYSEVGAGDARRSMVTITPSYEYMKKMAGTAKTNPDYATMMSLPETGISILIPNNKANNALYNGSQKSLSQLVADSGQKYSVYQGKDGHAELERTPDGRYQIIGFYKAYDGKTQKMQSTNFQSVISSDPSQLEKACLADFATMRNANKETETQFSNTTSNAR